MKYLKSTLLMSLFAASSLFADLPVKQVNEVYDGDTIKVDLNITNIPAVFGENISVRINGIDAPEKRGSPDLEKQAAYKVRDFVEFLLNDASIVLKNEGRDKYFRILADVLIDNQWDLATILLNMSYVKPYDGGTKEAWTEDELNYILSH